jgi:hypothetical protein
MISDFRLLISDVWRQEKGARRQEELEANSSWLKAKN